MKSLNTSNKMKNDIEKLMKNALDSYEETYQNGAWETFQKKMDEKSNVHSYKWWILGSSVSVIVVSTLLFFNNQETQNLRHIQTKLENEQPTIKSNASSSSSSESMHAGSKKII